MNISRPARIILIISGTLIILFIIGIFSINNILSHRAELMLRKQLTAIDTSLYRIDFRSVKVNVFTRAVRIYDIDVSPSPRALEKVKRSRLSPLITSLRVPLIRIGGVAVLKALREEEYSIGRISIEDPAIGIYSPVPIFSRASGAEGHSNDILSDTSMHAAMKRISLGVFEIANAHVQWKDMIRDKEMMKLDGLTMKIRHLELDPKRGTTLVEMIGIEDIGIAADRFLMELPGEMYNIRFSKLESSYSGSEISMDSLHLVPELPKGSFGMHYGKQTDRFDIFARRLDIIGIAFDSLFNKKVMIESADIHGVNADIFRDKRIARDMDIFPQLFQNALAELPVRLKIGRINFSKTDLKYAEMIQGADQAGEVRFGDMEISIKGIDNAPAAIHDQKPIEAHIKGILMDKASMEVFFNLPIGSRNDYFTFHGTTSSFELPIMNPLIEPLAYIETTKGMVESMRFYGMGRNDTAVGRIKFLYRDLQVAVIKKKPAEEGRIQENRLLSFIAKSIIHKNNPLHDKPPRIGKMAFARDLNKGFFNYVWKTVQNGLINTLVPVKRFHCYDMDWPTFEQKWVTVLNADRAALSLKTKKNKRKRK